MQHESQNSPLLRASEKWPRWLALAACLVAVVGRATPPGAPVGLGGPGRPALPAYQPKQQVRGTVRLWGHGSPTNDFMGRLVARWVKDFGRYQPGIAFDFRMYGTASAIGALYAGAGDLALMGEEIFPAEEAAYEKAMGHPPASVEIATGSLAVRNFDFAQMFFVHRDNPLRTLSLAQLDAIFGTERRRGAPEAIRTWGQLGLTGAWAGQPIHLYAWSFDNDFWIYLGNALLGGSHRLNPAIREYAHIHRPDGTIYDAGQQILEALAKDPYGLALSNVRYLNPEVAPLALSERAGEPGIAATPANLISRRYPLTRIIPAVYNQAPGQPPDPAVKEFLRYILSRDGQREIAEDGEYLPLDPAAVPAQLARLDAVDRTTIRIWGDEAMQAMVALWESGFRRAHPEAAFETKLTGTGTAIAGLYTGEADVAFMGRPVNPVEVMGFAWVKGHPPAAVEVMTGSVDVPEKSSALAVLVRRDNPIERITLAQLDGIFGCEHRRGGTNLRRWGQLGLTGAWAERPIRAYAREVDSGSAVFFRDLVLRGSRKWNWEALRDFEDQTRADGTVLPADAAIVGALAGDSGGIAVACAGFAGPGVKIVPVAADEDGPAWLPSWDTLISRRYPLARPVEACFDRPPGQPTPPKVKAFLDYILSPAGQADILREGDFLPLPVPPAAP